MEDAVELIRAVGIHNVIGGKIALGIHAHVERGILHIGEAALCRIDLMRRYAEVEDDTIHLLGMLVREDLFQMAEVVVYDIHMARDIREAFFGRLDSLLILVDADDAALRLQHLGDAVRVARAAQRTIHVRSLAVCDQSLDGFLQHHADMMEFHCSIPCPALYSESCERGCDCRDIRLDLIRVLHPLLLAPHFDAVVRTREHDILS